MPDERRAQGPKPVLRTRPVTMLTAIGLCVLIMVIRLVPRIPRSRFQHRADLRDDRSPITRCNIRALVRPPGSAHLEGQVARAHVLRQRSGSFPRHAARRLPPRCDDRAWRLRHHLPRLRHAARQGRRHQGIPADRVRHPPQRRRGGAARRAPDRGFHLGPRALPRRGARAGALPSSSYRAGAALLRGQRHGLYGDGVRGRQDRGRAPARPRPPPASRRCPAPGQRVAERPRGRTCPGLPASRHQAGEHHHPARQRSRPRRFRRRAAGDGRPHPHAHQRAHAAICADRAICPRRQAGRLERHLFRRRRPLSRDRGTDAARRRRARRQGSLSAVGRDGGRSLRAGVPGRDRPRDGLRAGRSAAEHRGMESVVRRLAAQGRGCTDATPCLQRRRRAAAPGRAQPRKGRAFRAAAAAVEIAAAIDSRALWDRRCRDGHADAVALPAGDPHAVVRQLANRVARRDGPVAAGACGPTSRIDSREPAAIGADARSAEGDRRAGPEGRRRCARGARARRRSSGHRACGGGRGANRGGTGRPAGPRARGAPVVRSGGELRRPGCRRQASGSRRRRPRQWRAPGGRLAGRPAERPRHGAARRRHALRRRVARRPIDRPWRAREAGRRPGRRQFRHGPTRRAGGAAHAGRPHCRSIRRLPRRYPGGARRRTGRGRALRRRLSRRPEKRLRPGDGGGRQGHGRPLGRRESASNQRLEWLAWKLRPAGCNPMHAPS